MKKSHPIRRVVLATAATVSGVVLLLSLKPASDPGAQAAGATPQQTAAAQESPQGGASAAGSANGTIDGAVAQTQYGNVQVRLTVANGKITKADAIQAPKGGTSDQKTALSIPKLTQETVAAQSAKIDSVSGATYTSNGYKQSLQSAIDKMKASAGTSQGSGSSQGSASPSQGSGGGSGSGTGSGSAQAKTVTGSVAQTQYGPVQVRITVSNGKITKADAVQAPKGGLSDQKTAMAVPKLNQEAVAAGSAKIDSVSGATYTSSGYKQSLQSALDQAGG
ncbi:FMN-binding protein [Streptomyces coacervatus]|uniref:FMN-binding protein n=1 Tax=Streptomyces coacervatus TaxID=647381 RepID=A0ABP7H814_9ACTN|nr:FMN-binding protein [Streptomyces coacervatus]MDF2267970.1 FMN-binding protein [Streptomyces coacervatus]